MSEPTQDGLRKCDACGGELLSPLIQQLAAEGAIARISICPFCLATADITTSSQSVAAILRGIARMLCANVQVTATLLSELVNPVIRVEDEVSAVKTHSGPPLGSLVDLQPSIEARVGELLERFYLADTPPMRAALSALVLEAISDALDSPIKLWPSAAGKVESPGVGLVNGDIESFIRILASTGQDHVRCGGKLIRVTLDSPAMRLECIAGAEQTWWFEPRSATQPATVSSPPPRVDGGPRIVLAVGPAPRTPAGTVFSRDGDLPERAASGGEELPGQTAPEGNTSPVK